MFNIHFNQYTESETRSPESTPALHTGAGGVRAGPHCGIRMQETVCTVAGLGAESREHLFGLFTRFLSSAMTKWAKDTWPSQGFHIKSHESTTLVLY